MGVSLEVAWRIKWAEVVTTISLLPSTNQLWKNTVSLLTKLRLDSYLVAIQVVSFSLGLGLPRLKFRVLLRLSLGVILVSSSKIM